MILPIVYQQAGVEPGKPLPAFTSVGCYTILYISKQGECYCGKCASVHDDDSDPIASCGCYDEGEPIPCEACGTDIESSYGPIES